MNTLYSQESNRTEFIYYNRGNQTINKLQQQKTTTTK
uniref:Uncharacterized protein n=1 Tax=Anguilla anguilla TaxID=7936 RepID=A0A0E9XY86_ANGAN